jgi:hypothetical protein
MNIAMHRITERTKSKKNTLIKCIKNHTIQAIIKINILSLNTKIIIISLVSKIKTKLNQTRVECVVMNTHIKAIVQCWAKCAATAAEIIISADVVVVKITNQQIINHLLVNHQIKQENKLIVYMWRTKLMRQMLSHYHKIMIQIKY